MMICGSPTIRTSIGEEPMGHSTNTISPLRQRMFEDMTMRMLSPKM